MNAKRILLATTVVAGPLLLIVAQSAYATPSLDLSLESFSSTILTTNGTSQTEPTVNVAPYLFPWYDPTISTSNGGSVNTITYPYTFSLTQGVAQSPSDPLWVVEPQNNSCSHDCPTITATIQFTLNFQYNGVNYPLVEDVDFSATEPDTDSLNWVGGTGTGGNGVYSFTIDGQDFQITLDHETDWNMAQYDGVEYTGPSSPVPEPASLAILGAGIVGFGVIRRRRRNKGV